MNFLKLGKVLSFFRDEMKSLESSPTFPDEDNSEICRFYGWSNKGLIENPFTVKYYDEIEYTNNNSSSKNSKSRHCIMYNR